MARSPGMLGNLPEDFHAGTINSPDLVELATRPFAYWGLVYAALERLAGEYGARCRFLRYEDLLAAPEDTVRGLCEFLEIPYAAAMLRPFCLPLSNASVVAMTERDFAAGRYVASQSAVGRWRRELRPDALAALAAANGALAARFGYALDDAPPADAPPAD